MSQVDPKPVSEAIDGLKSEFYLKCIRSLLQGLECENIEEFMERLSPDRCLGLGKAYTISVKRLMPKKGKKK